MILTGKSIAELINISGVTDNSLFLVNQDNITYSVRYSGMTTPMINTVVSAVTSTIANQAAGFAINPDIDSEIDITDLTYMSFSYDFSRESIPTSPVVSSSINQITVVGDYTSLISELPITLDRLYIEKSNYDYDINLYYYTSPVITSIGGNGSNTTFTFTPPLEAIYNQVQGIGSSNLGLYSHAEGVSTNANADYSHAEGGFTTSGAYGLYSTSISGGVITILNVPDNNQSDFFMLNKNEKDYIIFEDTRYENIYGFTTFEISGHNWVSSSLTLTINLVDTSVNTPAALIGTYIKTPYRLYNGIASHAEGFYTISNGTSSHAEGVYTFSLGEGSHAEGLGTSSFSLGSHSEGNSTKTLGDYSHAEGDNTEAIGYASHSEGNNTFSFGQSSHAEGTDTFAINNYTHTEGTATFAGCDYTYITSINDSRFINVLNSSNFTEGDRVAYVHNAGGGGNNVTNDIIVGITGNTIEIKNNGGGLNGNIFWGLNGNTTYAVLFRLQDNSDGRYAHSEGSFTAAIGLNSHSEGRKNAALGNHSHVEGILNQAAGTASHSEGIRTQSNGDYSHAEGNETKAGINAIPAYIVDATTLRLSNNLGDLSKSILFYDLSPDDLNYFYQNGSTILSGTLGSTIVENDGNYTFITASTSLPSYLIENTISVYNPKFSRVENQQIYPDGGPYNRFGEYSHAEGRYTISLGDGSHSEGYETKSYGVYSHAEGNNTQAIGEYSHAEGNSTQAIGDYSHAEGSTGMGGAMAVGYASHTEGIMNLAGAKGYSTQITNGIFLISEDLTDIFQTGEPIIYDDREYDNIFGPVKTTISASTYDGSNTNVIINNLTLSGTGFIYLPNNLTPRFATTSIGDASHAEGITTQALGLGSHSEGSGTLTLGYYSHAEGYGTITTKDYQHASGKFNKSGNTDSLMVVGNGTNENRSDIFYINENSVNIEGRLDNGYRTYKSLLTHLLPQNLTSNPANGLIVGETYKIASYVAGDDFLNVGASSNETDITFVATGRYPTNWGNSSQLTVDTPTLIVNVLENTFEDEIVWELNPFGEGTYVAYFNDGEQTFPREKTSIITSQITPYDYVPFIISPVISTTINSNFRIDDTIGVNVSAYDGSNIYNYDGLLFNTSIEIKSYVGFKPTVYLTGYDVYGNGTVDFSVTLASSGSSKVTEFGIVWSTSPNPTIADNKQIFGTEISSDSYNVDFNGQLGNYTYARAYAINRAGVAYHEVNQVTFIPND